MRFSARKFQFVFKVKFVSSALLSAVGFYCGLVQYVLVRNFWPGVEVFSGLLFFFCVGIYVGFAIPDVFRPKDELPQSHSGGAERDFNILLKYSFVMFSLAILLVLFVGFLLLSAFDRNISVILSHFLFTLPMWRIFAFLVPSVFVTVCGVIAGLICDFTYGFLMHFEYPSNIRAGAYEVHRCVCSVTGLILLAIVSGWVFGFYCSNICGVRWSGLIAFPIIFCLLVILILLLESSNYSDYMSYRIFPEFKSLVPAPEYASEKSLFATFMAIVVSGLSFWFIIHLKYALMNWVGSLNTFSEYPVGLSVFVLISVAFGLRLGTLFLKADTSGRYMTIVGRQGFAITIFGASIIGVIFLLSKMSLYEGVAFINSGAGVLLSLGCLAVIWSIAFVFTVPALSIGRANRFELWTAIGCRFAVGMMLSSVAYLCWHYLRGGNLSALIAGILLSVITGGIAVIYGEPALCNNDVSVDKKSFGRVIYVASIVLLYVIIILAVATVPIVKPVWLGGRRDKSILIAEGDTSVAAGISGKSVELLWAKRSIDERVCVDKRNELLELMRRIVELSVSNDSNTVRCLFIGLPFIERKDVRDMFGYETIEQVDIDVALRTMELELTGIKYPVAINRFDKVYCYHRPYDVIIAMYRRTCGKELIWPDIIKLFGRLTDLAVSPEKVWIISVDMQSGNRLNSLSKVNDKYYVKTITGKSSTWRIMSLSSSINLLDK